MPPRSRHLFVHALILGLLVAGCKKMDTNNPDDGTGAGGGRSKAQLLSVGTTDAAEMLSYHFTEASPAYCQTPDGLLDAIVARVAAVGGPCSAKKSVTGGPKDVLVVLRCSVDDPATGCAETYVGHLWIEQDGHSLSDYAVLAQGHARSVCKTTGVFPVTDEFRKEVERPSTEIEAVLQPCRQESEP